MLTPGEMAEWSIAAVLKTADGQPSGGSNPSLSAKVGYARIEQQALESERRIRTPGQTKDGFGPCAGAQGCAAQAAGRKARAALGRRAIPLSAEGSSLKIVW